MKYGALPYGVKYPGSHHYMIPAFCYFSHSSLLLDLSLDIMQQRDLRLVSSLSTWYPIVNDMSGFLCPSLAGRNMRVACEIMAWLTAVHAVMQGMLEGFEG